MNVKELRDILVTLPDDMSITVFAEGNIYPLLEVQVEEGVLNLGCGWEKMGDKYATS